MGINPSVLRPKHEGLAIVLSFVARMFMALYGRNFLYIDRGERYLNLVKVVVQRIVVH